MKAIHKVKLQEVINAIERTVLPSAMSKQEAMEFYEEVEAHITGNMDCLREEIKNEESEGGS